MYAIVFTTAQGTTMLIGGFLTHYLAEQYAQEKKLVNYRIIKR